MGGLLAPLITDVSTTGAELVTHVFRGKNEHAIFQRFSTSFPQL